MLDRRFLDALSIGAYRCATDGQILVANEAARAMLGPASSEDGVHLSQFMVDSGEFERMRATLEERGKASIRIEMRCADGSLFFAEHKAVLRVDDDLGETILDGVFIDVTDLAEAERNRDNALLSLRSLVDNTPGVAIQIYAPDGTVQLWNPASRSMYGFTAEEMIGRRIQEVLSPGNRKHFEKVVEEVVRTQQATSPDEWDMETRDGEARRVWSTMFPLALRDDEISIGCMDLDVTDRHQALQRVEAAKRQLSESERIANVGSWDWTIATDNVKWSEELCRICGVPYDEGAPRTYEDFMAKVHPEDRDRVVRTLSKTLADRGPFAFEHRVMRPDGQIRLLLSRGEVVLGEDGEPVGMLGTVEDLTEIRLIEADLRQREQHLHLVVDQMPAILWSTDRNLAFLSGRGGALAGLNLRANELTHKTLYEYFGTNDPSFPPIAAHLRALDGVSSSLETSWEGRTFQNFIEPLRDEQADVIGCVGVALDITERVESDKALAASEDRYRLLADNSHDLIGLTDVNGTMLYASPSHRDILGYDPATLPAKNIFDFVHPDDAPALIAAASPTSDASTAGPIQARIKRSDGSWLEVEALISAVTTEGHPDRLLFSAHDVSARNAAERALRESEERYRSLFERNLAGVYRTTVDGRIVDCNDACARIFGYETGKELLGLGAADVYFDPAERREMIGRLKEQGIITNLEHAFRRRDGSTVWALENITYIAGSDDASSILEGTIIDISERKQAEQEIVHQAHHDALTSLPNRVLFRDRLSLTLSHSKRNQLFMAVLFIDVDHFKLINDTLGHTVGDLMLKSVAERLREGLRDEDTVARVGGDEFTILIPEIAAPDHADRIARKLLDRIATPFVIQGQELFITASIGIAIYPNDGITPEALLKNADAAMYRAKELGRNNAQMCSPAMTVRALERLGLENGLRRAIDREQLVLHYQPIIDLLTGKVASFEALVRWNHPERGLLAPDSFISIAEDSRLILPIGKWVLATACKQLQQWKIEGFETRMAVNLSARQFQTKELPLMVAEVLAQTGIDARCIDLEITETTAMQNADMTIEVLRELTHMGFGIVIDDFGTGYSSLSYLKRFPISALKIDRSFVRDVTTTRSDAAIVSAIIATASALELRVVAEGVETSEQLALLSGLACNEAQGFLFSRPKPPLDFPSGNRSFTIDSSTH